MNWQVLKFWKKSPLSPQHPASLEEQRAELSHLRKRQETLELELYRVRHGRDASPRVRTVNSVLLVFIAIGLLTLIFFGAYSVTLQARGRDEPYDLPAMLFAAAAFALVLFSIFFVVLTLVGWKDLKEKMSNDARALVRHEYELAAKESLGKLRINVGWIFGTFAQKNSDAEIVIDKPEYLLHAIEASNSALTLLVDSPEQWKAMNNLAFYSALGEDAAYGFIARDLALELRRMPEAMSQPEVRSTYARVVATYHRYFDAPREAILDAQNMINCVLTGEIATELEKRNARRHLEALGRALASLPSVP